MHKVLCHSALIRRMKDVLNFVFSLRCGVCGWMRVRGGRFQRFFARADGRLLRPDDGPLDEREQHAGPSIDARGLCAQRTPVRCWRLWRQHRSAAVLFNSCGRDISMWRQMSFKNVTAENFQNVWLLYFWLTLCVFAGLSTVEAYNAKTDEWFHVAPMSTRRSSVGVGVVNGEYDSQTKISF